MTNDEVEKLDYGLYLIHWKESEGGGTSLASVGGDQYGRRWFAATNWTSGPSFDWSRVASMELIRGHQDRRPAATVEGIKGEAEAQLAKYPAVDYVPHWHPYYWIGQRDAAKRMESEAK